MQNKGGYSMKLKLHEPTLSFRHEFIVRFSEVDMMKVVWHGSYVIYLEDGREKFGANYAGIGYDDYLRMGYVAPVVNMQIEYKQSLKAGEKGIVETRYIYQPGAKLTFEYVIYRSSDMEVMAIATTTQVFVSPQGEMQYTCPEFFEEWKKRWLPSTLSL